jgi:uncharacterized membrane protein
MLKQVYSKIKNYFFIGLATFIPVYVTVIIFIKIISFFDNLIGHIIKHLQLSPSFMFLQYPGVGIALSGIFFIFLGFLSRQYLGNKVITLVEKIFSIFPIVKEVYSAIKKLAHSIIDGERSHFSRVVLVPFPHENVYAIGFLTGMEVDKEGMKKCYVYVPTAINPTSGFLIMVKEEHVKKSDLTIEEAFALILSGGMSSPKR